MGHLTPGLHWSEGAGKAVALYSVQRLGMHSTPWLHSTSIHTLLHPDLVLVPFSNNPKSSSALFVQYTCVYSRAQLAKLKQQNFAGRTAKQCTVTNLYSGRNLKLQRDLSAEWLDAVGAVGEAMNKISEHE